MTKTYFPAMAEATIEALKQAGFTATLDSEVSTHLSSRIYVESVSRLGMHLRYDWRDYEPVESGYGSAFWFS